jgi:hypothetical protein
MGGARQRAIEIHVGDAKQRHRPRIRARAPSWETSSRESRPSVRLWIACWILPKAVAVESLAMAISILPRQASDPLGLSGVPAESVALISSSLPSQCTTPHLGWHMA